MRLFDSNVVIELVRRADAALHACGWWFYNFIGAGGCRLMCAWDTTAQDVDDFAAEMAALTKTV